MDQDDPDTSWIDDLARRGERTYAGVPRDSFPNNWQEFYAKLSTREKQQYAGMFRNFARTREDLEFLERRGPNVVKLTPPYVPDRIPQRRVKFRWDD